MTVQNHLETIKARLLNQTPPTPDYERIQPVKPSINIGCLLDIPTGSYIEGIHGEHILNGGKAHITGIVGKGNNFKSTIMHYCDLTALERMMMATFSSLNTYDTEMNIQEAGLRRFLKRFPLFREMDIIDAGFWSITDKVNYYANEWFEKFKEFLKERRKNKAKLELETPFVDRDGVSLMKMIVPTFHQVDSFTEFESEAVAGIANDNELGEASGNTIHMKQGLDKTRFLMELPVLSLGSNAYVTLTAHVGKKIEMASGPVKAPPDKQLHNLKHGDVVKGVTNKFFFLMLNCWHAMGAAPLVNQGTGAAEYPRAGENDAKGDTDLNTVKLIQLRGKNGLTGYTVEIVVSQSEGVLPSLTEFHYLKKRKFGFTGNDRSYVLDLYPDCSLSRTTIRDKLDEDQRLARAMNITAEIMQIKEYWPTFDKDLWCEPKVLYEDLKKMRYDWNVLLDTRGWWTLQNDKQPIPYLSTMDLFRMRKGLYKPYWMK